MTLSRIFLNLFWQKYQEGLGESLNHEQIMDHPERISKIKPFIDQYDQKEIYFPSQGKGWKKFE